MKYQKTVRQFFILVIICITVFSCTYEKQDLKVNCVLPATVSFSQDIIPIFNANCNISGCHTGAAHAGSLNLEATAAYSQLLSSGTGYVDTINPQFSILYNKLITASDRMPPGGQLDNCKIQLILKWIQQKARNN
jgi:hypothetical protein